MCLTGGIRDRIDRDHPEQEQEYVRGWRNSQINGVTSIESPGLDVQHRKTGKGVGGKLATAQALPQCVTGVGCGAGVIKLKQHKQPRRQVDDQSRDGNGNSLNHLCLPLTLIECDNHFY